MIPFPPGPYRCVVADPPWSYRNIKTGGSMTSGATAQYATLSSADLAVLPVRDLVDPEGCILFLWATVPLLPEAVALMAAWGFRYKTSLFWEKTGRLGMGFWFRGQVEVCLVGISGTIPALRCQQRNVIHAPVTTHSAKPDAFFDLIEPCLDAHAVAPRIEIFARRRRPGWDAWGDQVDP